MRPLRGRSESPSRFRARADKCAPRSYSCFAIPGSAQFRLRRPVLASFPCGCLPPAARLPWRAGLRWGRASCPAGPPRPLRVAGGPPPSLSPAPCSLRPSWPSLAAGGVAPLPSASRESRSAAAAVR